VPPWFETARVDLTERLPTIGVPVLLLWGSADPISPVAVGERLRELIPDCELVVVDGGNHDLIFERADDVIVSIRRHLQKAARQ
jgi:pimeloyl-ACP methyl ester carboxylesterase